MHVYIGGILFFCLLPEMPFKESFGENQTNNEANWAWMTAQAMFTWTKIIRLKPQRESQKLEVTTRFPSNFTN